ncbi:MAG: hypothetical protein JXM69_05850 [Anaerolineae bacterium]|nr:hypothetical protein [Anaerolineae bacterium]
MSLRTLYQNRKFQLIILLILVLLQVIRLLAFIDEYGGLIQDSGWSLGIARSLAERGTYTTMVATITDPTITAGPSLQGEFHIQDNEGRLYFRSDRPALIIPQAIIFKIFGFKFWTYRAGSLLFFVIFLLIASIFLWFAGGIEAVAFFHVYLYLYPSLLIYLSFQTLGEMAALAYIMLAFALFVFAYQQQNRRGWCFFASGIAVGLALYSKLISALALSALGWLGLLFLCRKQATWREIFVFLIGCMTFPTMWELFQLISIIRITSFETYLRHIGFRYEFAKDYGRGQDDIISPPLEFAWDKLKIITEISQPNLIFACLTLLIILIGGAYLIWRWREEKVRHKVIFLFWVGWLTHYIWFVVWSTGGVTRYNWISLMLGVLSLTIVVIYVFKQTIQTTNWRWLALSGGILLILILNFSTQYLAFSPVISEELIEAWRLKQVYGKYIQMPSMIIPSQAQNEVIDFIKNDVPKARVFYALGYRNGEIASQTGRIFYPLQRRINMPPLPGDVVIINPGIISTWRKPPDLHDEILAEVERQCPNMIFRNDYYILCALD